MNNKLASAILFGATAFALTLVGCDGCSDSSGKDPGDDWKVGQSLDFGIQPRWNPNGGSILFGDDTPGRLGLWIWNLTGTPTQPADSLPPHNWDYCWSPDGSKIAFTAPGASEDSISGVWIVDVATRTKRHLFTEGRDVAWADSGRSVIFRLDNPGTGVPGIYLMGLDDALPPSLVVAGGMLPKTAPGGVFVAYSTGEINAQLYAMNLASASPVPDTIGPIGAVQWAWSGDGQYLYIVYNRYASGLNRGVIWRASLASSFAVDSVTSYAAYPSPDRTGSKFVYMQSSSGRWTGVWMRNFSGNDILVARYGVNPDLEPNGARVALNALEGGIRIYEPVQ